jgi:hypothetical protein
MNYSLSNSIEILERTPEVLMVMLKGLSADWTCHNEGPATWNVCDVIGHLIHGEKTDWRPRMDIILSGIPGQTFDPFDPLEYIHETKGKSLLELLEEFKRLRQKNVAYLKSKNLSASELELTGIHPEFGKVTLSQMLSTWTVHDLNHIAQISRIMAKQYKDAVGPWTAYLRILQS